MSDRARLFSREPLANFHTSMRAVLKALWGFDRQLKLLFLLKFIKSMTENGLSLIFIIYLTEHLGFSMMHANWMYIAWNILSATWAIPIGWYVDHGSLKYNLLFGSVLNVIGKIITLIDYSRGLSIFAILVISNLGAEFIEKVLSVAVSKQVPKDKPFERNLAFQFGYSVENIGAAISFLYWDYVSNHYTDQSIPLIMMFSSISGLMFMLCALTFVNPQVERRDTEPDSITNTLLDIARDRVFWRLVAFGFALVGLGVFWNYNSVVFPLYMKHEIKSNHYGNVESINPIFIPLFTMIIGAIFPRVDPFHMVIYGSLIFSLSAMPMIFSSTMSAAELYVFWMTIGEAIYSPKVELVEFNIAPPQLAGTYTSLTKIPVGLFRVAGMLSNSFLIDDMCSENVADKCRDIWAIATGVALSTPLLLVLLSRFIQDAPPAAVIRVGLDTDASSDGTDDVIRSMINERLAPSQYTPQIITN